MSRSVITVIGKDRIGIVYDVSKLLAENQELQKQCPHHFTNRYCDYCYKKCDNN